MASRVSRFAQRSQSMKHWPNHASAPPGGYTPLSGTPPSPSARQARLISPSHSLPEFLPVLDESSTLKAPLILPASSLVGVSSSRLTPQLPPLPSGRRSVYDLRRGISFQASQSSLSSGSSSSWSSPGEHPKNLTEWVPHLMVFSMLCLVVTVASVAYSISVVDQYDQTETGTFFQITDVHWDPLYRYHATPTSFCRIDLLAAADKPFGQYGCDSPLLLLKTALMEMQGANPRPDFVLLSGDSVAHNLTAWQTLSALSKVDEAVAQTFDGRFTKRLHALGEQELAVLEDGKTNFTDWLASVARVWNSSLTEASDDAYETFLKGGYYMAVIPSQSRGGPSRKFADSEESPDTSNVAALILNTLLYSTREGALQKQMDSTEDPQGQLAWLHQQLQQARHWGRKVVIAGHLPPGMDTARGEPMWRQEYVERYMDIVLDHNDVVVGQLFGYLHRDHFTLMHDDNPEVVPEWGLKGGRASIGKRKRTEGKKGRKLGKKSSQRESLVERLLASLAAPVWRGPAGVGGSSSHSESMDDRAAVTESSPGLAQEDTRHGLLQREHLSSPNLLTRPGARDEQLRPLRRRLLGDPGPHERQVRAASARPASVASVQGDDKPAAGKGLREFHPVIIDGDSTLAVMIAPSLSPVMFNRPAFRMFSYDRAGLLLDYVQHTANLKLQGAEQMWEVQYGARSVYELDALDGSNFADLSSSFFNSTGYPTEAFSEFCALRAAGNRAAFSGPFDCCSGCPNFMRCAVETFTIDQFQACNGTVNSGPTTILRQ